jgi:2-polyprenyl-6-hydroxyphenyl methylase/3-demethylubiquinone-9 3-methyltransferase
MTDYYAKKLPGRRLERCYELASPRVQQYLEAEIRHLRGRLRASDRVLELGCGYGRIALRLAETAAHVVGIDTSRESIAMAGGLAGRSAGIEFVTMDALDLSFADGEFDAVICAQNGICAFGVDQLTLAREALRVVRPGGILLLSTYSDRFWPERLAWFEAQAAAGLLGAIDHQASGDGVIVCRDGFRAGCQSPDGFRALCAALEVECDITEVDGSSLFCEIRRPGIP